MDQVLFQKQARDDASLTREIDLIGDIIHKASRDMSHHMHENHPYHVRSEEDTHTGFLDANGLTTDYGNHFRVFCPSFGHLYCLFHQSEYEDENVVYYYAFATSTEYDDLDDDDDVDDDVTPADPSVSVRLAKSEVSSPLKQLVSQQKTSHCIMPNRDTEYTH